MRSRAGQLMRHDCAEDGESWHRAFRKILDLERRLFVKVIIRTPAVAEIARGACV
jgi:hypothetical protein